MVNVAATVNLAGSAGASMSFGDETGGGSGSANWDYVNVNPVSTPEPSTLTLLVMGLIGLLCYAWRKRK